MKLPSVLLCAVMLGAAVELPAADSPPTLSSGFSPFPDQPGDGAVTFRLRAPAAKQVLLLGQWPGGRVPLVRDAQGVWTVTVGPIDPGVWEYAFEVDGLRIIDPGNPALKPMRAPAASILHIPANPPAWHDLQKVPHGVVHQHVYWSKALQRSRPLMVYTPPGYAAAATTRYPTLYLQHGGGDNEATWTVLGKAHWILDNLIAAGRAKPMVVVMMDGHAVPGGPGDTNIRGFERDLIQDVIPLVEAGYAVRSDASHRALVGLSMGGGQSLTVGLTHLDRFAWIGAFSAGGADRAILAPVFANAERANAHLKLLWIACGRDDRLLPRVESFVESLRQAGVRHEWKLTPGGHSWPVWREYLAELAPRLFNPE